MQSVGSSPFITTIKKNTKTNAIKNESFIVTKNAFMAIDKHLLGSFMQSIAMKVVSYTPDKQNVAIIIIIIMIAMRNFGSRFIVGAV